MASSLIHIGNIPEQLAEGDFLSFLTQAEITPSGTPRILSSFHPRTDRSQTTGKYSIVTFDTDAMAAHAIEHINNLTLTIDDKRYHLTATQFIPDFKNRKSKGTGNIIIKNLPSDIDTSSLKDAYAAFGKVLTSYVRDTPNPSRKGGLRRDGPVRPAPVAGPDGAVEEPATASKIGYVMFDTDEQAAEAILGTNGRYLGRNCVIVEKFLTLDQRLATEARVYARGIPGNVTPEDLKAKIEEACGNVFSSNENLRISLKPDARVPKSLEEDPAGPKQWCVLPCDSREVANRVVEYLRSEAVTQEMPGLFVDIFKTKGIRERERALRVTSMQRQIVDSKRNISVFNIKHDLADEVIKAFFSRYGTIQTTSRPITSDKSRVFDNIRHHINILYETVDAASNAVRDAAIDERALPERLAINDAGLDIKYYTPDNKRHSATERRATIPSIAIPGSTAMIPVYTGIGVGSYMTAPYNAMGAGMPPMGTLPSV